MSSLSISATDKDGKTTTFARSIITREEIANAKTFLDTIQTDEGNDPTKRTNSAGGSITGATSSSEPKADASSKETAWTGKEGEAEPKDKSKEKNTP